MKHAPTATVTVTIDGRVANNPVSTSNLHELIKIGCQEYLCRVPKSGKTEIIARYDASVDKKDILKIISGEVKEITQ